MLKFTKLESLVAHSEYVKNNDRYIIFATTGKTGPARQFSQLGIVSFLNMYKNMSPKHYYEEIQSRCSYYIDLDYSNKIKFNLNSFAKVFGNICTMVLSIVVKCTIMFKYIVKTSHSNSNLPNVKTSAHIIIRLFDGHNEVLFTNSKTNPVACFHILVVSILNTFINENVIFKNGGVLSSRKNNAIIPNINLYEEEPLILSIDENFLVRCIEKQYARNFEFIIIFMKYTKLTIYKYWKYF